VLPSGCSKSHGWSAAGAPESNCWVEQLSCDGRVFAVLAANGSSKGTSSGEGNGTFRGEFLVPDGRKIAWSCSTSDAERGTMTISGQRFELREGGVVLVRTNEPEIKVRQLVVEQSKVQAALGERLRRLAAVVVIVVIVQAPWGEGNGMAW
jgi:hypothetical protein